MAVRRWLVVLMDDAATRRCGVVPVRALAGISRGDDAGCCLDVLDGVGSAWRWGDDLLSSMPGIARGDGAGGRSHLTGTYMLSSLSEISIGDAGRASAAGVSATGGR